MSEIVAQTEAPAAPTPEVVVAVEAAAEPATERRATRSLTQRYDMNALRAIQKIEQDFTAALAELFACEEDDLPVEVDTLALFNSPPESRRDLLIASMSAAPADASALIETVLAELAKLDGNVGETGR